MAETDLLRLLPPVLRAREFRLYTEGGRRFVDLWQHGGRAVLGHTPPNLLRELKNAANRGLMSPFPHPLEKRLVKALSKLFPDKIFRIYADDASLHRALESAGFSLKGGDPIPDPAVVPGTVSGHRISLWRPFLDNPGTAAATASPGKNFAGNPILIPILPWSLSPQVLVMEESRSSEFLPSDIISPLILAAATRGIYDLIAAPERGSTVFPKINKVLYGGPGRQAPGARSGEFLAKTWRRRGIYLTHIPALSADSYAALFRRFLDAGFLLPPSPREPLILPGIMSPGEEAKLAELLSEVLKDA
ncbi:hypothetical protein AGMMS49587_08920 [Spirochaetia bacterium]|nr:hypothetical protein AGMMS49587_08920 [Spirochaetia bacterium]